MKFSTTIDINRPLDIVIEKFDNTANLKEWQEGMVSFDHLSGVPGTPGAKSRIIYKNKNGPMELIETIISKRLPEEFNALYEHKHMVNTMRHSFKPVSDRVTRWEAEVEYTRFIGLLPKIMSVLMSGMFRKEGKKWMERFKIYAEKEA
jgi:hypothetical protein